MIAATMSPVGDVDFLDVAETRSSANGVPEGGRPSLRRAEHESFFDLNSGVANWNTTFPMFPVDADGVKGYDVVSGTTNVPSPAPMQSVPSPMPEYVPPNAPSPDIVCTFKATACATTTDTDDCQKCVEACSKVTPKNPMTNAALRACRCTESYLRCITYAWESSDYITSRMDRTRLSTHCSACMTDCGSPISMILFSKKIHQLPLMAHPDHLNLLESGKCSS